MPSRQARLIQAFPIKEEDLVHPSLRENQPIYIHPSIKESFEDEETNTSNALRVQETDTPSYGNDWNEADQNLVHSDSDFNDNEKEEADLNNDWVLTAIHTTITTQEDDQDSDIISDIKDITPQASDTKDITP
ncbi:hypothetical protein N7466_006200 [Penicillium verhagenii]|uniref:uncharacterized protein n=1 Tax=Penicillium verhagenii TaxID=1562060 RepID=UPI0025459488|nr:uncharacterized protein N7466_006200 [Penicillium verhagenii]KAJ5930707.1 hypothetical protein N7466_006200 [Penicillium verhagenii]